MMAFKSFCYVILLLNFVANFCMISGYTIKSMMKTRAYVPGVYMSEVPEPAKAVEQSALKSKLSADMKDAMKQKQKDRLAGIRAIQTAIKQKEVDERVVVDDETAVNIMAKLVKQRRESIKSYSDTGRQDLVAIEQAELEVISSYMPTQLSEVSIQLLCIIQFDYYYILQTLQYRKKF